MLSGCISVSILSVSDILFFSEILIVMFEALLWLKHKQRVAERKLSQHAINNKDISSFFIIVGLVSPSISLRKEREERQQFFWFNIICYHLYFFFPLSSL